MKTIVCFGDSNTYGTPALPKPMVWGRFAAGERWPGVMRDALGAGFTVIEEALPGRTTVHDDPIDGVEKNGLKALPMVLGSHRPIDLLIIKLGTNDLKARFAVTADDIATSVGVLVRTIRASEAGVDGKPPQVFVVVPAPILEVSFMAGYFRGGAEKSKEFGRAYAAVMERLDVSYLDAGRLIASDPLDGIHLARDQHVVLGQAIAARVSRMWQAGL